MYTPLSSTTPPNPEKSLCEFIGWVFHSLRIGSIIKTLAGRQPPPHLHFQYYIRVYHLSTVSPKLIDKTVQNLNGQNSWAIDWSCVDELLEPPPCRHPNRFRTNSWFLNTFKMGFKTLNRVIRGLRPDRTTQSTILNWSGFSIFFVLKHTYSIITVCICTLEEEP